MSDSDDNLVLFRRKPAALDRRRIEAFARVLREQVAGGRIFRCLITGDRELRRLNREFLGKDYATDVLSFPAGGGDELGEIAISAARAAAQALEHGHSPAQEVEVLMLHGVLHLLGMDHETDGGRMAQAEARWRERLGLPQGLIERAGA